MHVVSVNTRDEAEVSPPSSFSESEVTFSPCFLPAMVHVDICQRSQPDPQPLSATSQV